VTRSARCWTAYGCRQTTRRRRRPRSRAVRPAAVFAEPVQGEGGPPMRCCARCDGPATTPAHSWFSTRSSAASGVPARCGRTPTPASNPTCCSPARPSAVARGGAGRAPASGARRPDVRVPRPVRGGDRARCAARAAPPPPRGGGAHDPGQPVAAGTGDAVHHATGHAAVHAIGVELDVDRLATVVSGQQQRLAGIEQVRAAPAPASDFSVRCKPRCAVRGSYPVNCATLPVHCRTGYSNGCNSGSSAVVGPGWPPPCCAVGAPCGSTSTAY
jgi:hypothetical protein